MCWYETHCHWNVLLNSCSALVSRTVSLYLYTAFFIESLCADPIHSGWGILCACGRNTQHAINKQYEAHSLHRCGNRCLATDNSLTCAELSAPALAPALTRGTRIHCHAYALEWQQALSFATARVHLRTRHQPAARASAGPRATDSITPSSRRAQDERESTRWQRRTRPSRDSPSGSAQHASTAAWWGRSGVGGKGWGQGWVGASRTVSMQHCA